MPTLTDYPGSKVLASKKLISLIPPHRVFIEAFAGSAALTQIKRPAPVNLLIEIDPITVAHLAGEFPAARVFHPVPGQPSAVPLEEIATPIYESGAIADPVYPVPRPPSPVYKILHASALDILPRYPYTGQEFIYLDPPYLLNTRRSQRKLYRHELTTESEHAALLEIARNIPAPVMISGYPSPFYDELLPEWHKYEFTVQTHAGPARESVWMNYPRPTSLHDYRFIGENFTDRQRIKRKATRWVTRFLQTDLIERQAIIAELTARGILSNSDIP